MLQKILLGGMLILLTGCASGSELNSYRSMTNGSNRMDDEREMAINADFCRSKVHEKVDGFRGPLDVDYDALFNACMAKKGWVPRVGLAGPVADAPEVNP